jgi:hypothetical protein
MVSGATWGKVGAKFWVFASAEASVTAGGEPKRSGTQTLTLKPRLETTVTNAQRRSDTTTRGIVVDGQLAADEQPAPPPRP